MAVLFASWKDIFASRQLFFCMVIWNSGGKGKSVSLNSAIKPTPEAKFNGVDHANYKFDFFFSSCMDEKIQSRINVKNAYLLFYTVQNCFGTLGWCFKQVANVTFHSKTWNLHSYTGVKKNPIEKDPLMTSCHHLMSLIMKLRCRGKFSGLKEVELQEAVLWSFW